MQQFMTRHAQKITGVLSGFDRILCHGHLLPLCHERGVYRFLSRQAVLLKEFGRFVAAVAARIGDAALRVVGARCRPICRVSWPSFRCSRTP